MAQSAPNDVVSGGTVLEVDFFFFLWLLLLLGVTMGGFFRFGRFGVANAALAAGTFGVSEAAVTAAAAVIVAIRRDLRGFVGVIIIGALAERVEAGDLVPALGDAAAATDRNFIVPVL